MRFLELHFNPQKGYSADVIFDSFCYEPENVYERKLGPLFIVGELKNPLPSNSKLIEKIARFIKRTYYSAPPKSSPEIALKRTLKKANEFLESIAKQGDVSWLGSLNLAVFNIENQNKDSFLVSFSKVGTIKILLLRPGQIIDIGKNLDFSEIEPYPLKIFSNIVSGKLTKEDFIGVLTNAVFEYFSEAGLLKQITEILSFSNSELKKLLKTREKELKKISGVCLLCALQEPSSQLQKSESTLIFRKGTEKFHPFKALFSSLKRFQKSALKKPITKIKLKSVKLEAFLRRFKLPIKKLWVRKNIILILFWVLLLLLGLLLF